MNFTDWEHMKIAGMTEHNKQIDEMRKSSEAQQANNLLISQLQTINDNLQKQIDDAK